MTVAEAVEGMEPFKSIQLEQIIIDSIVVLLVTTDTSSASIIRRELSVDVVFSNRHRYEVSLLLNDPYIVMLELMTENG